MKLGTPRNWWARQQRRFRLSIIKLRRRERASELRVEADPLPEAGDRERETSAFWFRRVTTTVLLGNGTGIVALGSYVASGNLSPDVARLAYPAISSFLTGALLGFGCYILSFFSASMRFEAYTTVLEKAAQIARREGKKFATTQHDGAFYSLIIIVALQVTFLILSAINFYSGSSYVLSALGKSACAEDQQTYCYGSPILFPFVDPYDFKTATDPVEVERPPHSDFQVEGISEGDGSNSEVVRLSVYIPGQGLVTDLVPKTTVQITSYYGASCRFGLQWFSIGGPVVLKTGESEKLQEELLRRRYNITPVSTRLYVEYHLSNGKTSTEAVYVDLSSGKALKVNSDAEPEIDLYVFMYGGPLGYAIEPDNVSDSGIRCLELAKRAGFGLSERAEKLLARLDGPAISSHTPAPAARPRSAISSQPTPAKQR